MAETLADCVVALVTLPPDADAGTFAAELVGAGVAACVTLLPQVRSVYRWEGNVEDEAETQILIKTTSDAVPRLWDRVRTLHPYEVPEFIVLPIIDGNEGYLNWIRNQIMN